MTLINTITYFTVHYKITLCPKKEEKKIVVFEMPTKPSFMIYSRYCEIDFFQK